jgi:hypothetical protein
VEMKRMTAVTAKQEEDQLLLRLWEVVKMA